MRRRSKADANAREIIQALRAAGASVLVLSQLGDDCPDLLVGYADTNTLLEVKNPNGRNRLSAGQQRFIERWQGPVLVVRSAAEALAGVGFPLPP